MDNKMLHRRIQKGIEKLKGLQLSVAEKEHMLKELKGYAGIESPTRPIASPWSYLVIFRSVSVAFLVCLVVFSGVVFASDQSVPGDVLYPVKLHVEEPIRGALAFGTQAKIDWETEKAQRRLTEAQTLAASNRLSTTTREIIQNEFIQTVQRIHVLSQQEKDQENQTENQQQADQQNLNKTQSQKQQMSRHRNEAGSDSEASSSDTEQTSVSLGVSTLTPADVSTKINNGHLSGDGHDQIPSKFEQQVVEDTQKLGEISSTSPENEKQQVDRLTHVILNSIHSDNEQQDKLKNGHDESNQRENGHGKDN